MHARNGKDDYLRELQAQAEAKKREKLEEQLRERVETLQHMAGNRLGVQENGQGGDDVAGLHRLLREQGARLNGQARQLGVEVDHHGGVAAAHPNVRRPLAAPPPAILQQQAPTTANGLFGRPVVAGAPVPLIQQQPNQPAAVGISRRDEAWERKRQQRLHQQAAGHGGINANGGAVAASPTPAANRRDEVYEQKRREFLMRQQGAGEAPPPGVCAGPAVLQQMREDKSHQNTAPSWGCGPSSCGAAGVADEAPRLHNNLGTARCVSKLHQQCSMPPNEWACTHDHGSACPNGQACHHDAHDSQKQGSILPSMSYPIDAVSRPEDASGSMSSPHEIRRRQQQEYARALSEQQEQKRRIEEVQQRQGATTYRPEATGDGALSPQDRRRQQQDYAQALHEQQEQKQRMQEAQQRRDNGSRPELTMGGVPSPHDIRRRQQQEYARALQEQQEQKRRAQEAEQQRNLSAHPQVGVGGALSPHEIRRRQQQQYARALEEQQHQRDEARARERMLANGVVDDGFGHNADLQARRAQQREYREALERQQREKEANEARERALDAGGGLRVGINSTSPDERRRKQQEYAHALAEQQQAKLREAQQERAGQGGDGFGFGHAPSNDERRKQQAEYAAALEAQMAGARGGGRPGRGGPVEESEGLFAGMGRADEEARRRKAGQASYAMELQAQADEARRRKESEKEELERIAKKADEAEFDVFGRPLDGRVDPAEERRRAILAEQQRGIAEQRAQRAAARAAAKEAERLEEEREAAKIERDRQQLREQFEREQEERRRKEEAKASGKAGAVQSKGATGSALASSNDLGPGGGFLSKEEKQARQAEAYHRKMEERERHERMGGGARGGVADGPTREPAPTAHVAGAADASLRDPPPPAQDEAALAAAVAEAAARAEEHARLEREAAQAHAEREALLKQNEALQRAVREQAEVQQRLMAEQMERMTRMEEAQLMQQQAHLEALRQQAAQLQAAVAPLHAQGALAVAAIARAHPDALNGMLIPLDANEGEQSAHHHAGNRLDDMVMRTPYIEEAGCSSAGQQRARPPPTAPDDALIRLMVPTVDTNIPPPFGAGGAGGAPHARDSSDVEAQACRSSHRMLALDTKDEAAAPYQPSVNQPAAPLMDGGSLTAREIMRRESTARAPPNLNTLLGASLGSGNGLRESLRGDSEWIFPPQDQLNASLQPELRLPSASAPITPAAADVPSCTCAELAARAQSRGRPLQPVLEETARDSSPSNSGVMDHSSPRSRGASRRGHRSAPSSRPASGARRGIEDSAVAVDYALPQYSRSESTPLCMEGGGAAGTGAPSSATSRAMSRDGSRRAFTPGLDSLVRRAEDRLRQLQLSEVTPDAPVRNAGARPGPSVPPTPALQSEEDESLRRSMSAHSAMCLPSEGLPPLSAVPPTASTTGRAAAESFRRLERLECCERELGVCSGAPRAEPSSLGLRPVSAGRRQSTPGDGAELHSRPITSPAPSEGGTMGGYTRAMGARTEAQLQRIAELERHIAGARSTAPSSDDSQRPPPTNAMPRESTPSASGDGDGTVGEFVGTRTMEERLRRLAALEKELGTAGGGGGKEELDQLLAQWTGEAKSSTSFALTADELIELL